MRGNGRRAVRLGVLTVLVVIGWPGGAAGQERAGPGSVTLEEAVRTAVRQNRELEAARLELVVAAGQVREAWSAVYPTLNASGSYTRNVEVPGQFLPARFFDPNAGENDQVLVRFGADNSWYGQLRLEQPLFQASAFIGVGAAARYRALQEEVVRGRIQQVVTRTKRSYYDVLLATEAARLNAESVRRVRQTLEETRAMNRAGVVGDYDVLRLEVELANLEPALRRSENALTAARRSLAVTLAMDEAAELEAVGSLSAQPLTSAEAQAEGPALLQGFGVEPEEGSVEDLVRLAVANRSEVRQLRLMEALRTAELRAEQSEYLPRVALFATYAYNAQADGAINPFAFHDARSVTTPQVGLSVTVPLFKGFSRPARVQQRRAGVHQLGAQIRQAEAEVGNQVRTLAEQVREARERAEAQAHARTQAQRGYEIARAQFREGLGSRLELTDAEVALRQSEFNYAQAVYDYLAARALLDEAVGATSTDF